MAEPFLGEVRVFGIGFAPQGFADCCGQSMSKEQNQSLFNAIGTTYGGDGEKNFNLPDLQGRTPVHQTTGYSIGQKGGSETVALTDDTIPPHTHGLNGASVDASVNEPANATLAKATCYAMSGDGTAMTGCIGSGANKGHDNVQPSLGLRFVIAIAGKDPK